jgi:hypothetical protein
LQSYVISSSTALKAVIASSEKSVLLLLDETLKCTGQLARLSPNQSGPVELLKIVGRHMNDFGEQLHVVVSTLNQVPLVKFKTASGRPVLWAPLPRLLSSQVLNATKNLLVEYHKTHFFEHLKRKIDAKKNVYANDALEILVIFCNGHPRTIEAMVNYIKTTKEPPRNWKECLQGIITNMSQKTLLLPQWPHVHAALMAKSLSLDESLPANTKGPKLSSLIEQGYFLNSQDQETGSPVCMSQPC